MAAPSVVRGTTLDLSTARMTASASFASATIINGRYRFNNISTTSGVLTWCEWAFASPVDFTDKIFAATVEWYFTGNNASKIGLFTTSNTNYRVWTVGVTGNSQFIGYVVDPSQGTFVDTGTFDITHVRGIRLEVLPSNTNATRGLAVHEAGFFIDKNEGIELIGGEVGDEARIRNIVDSALVWANTSETSVSGGGPLAVMPFGISIGDGSTSSLYAINQGAFFFLGDSFAYSVSPSGSQLPWRLVNGPSPAVINTAATATINNIQLIAETPGDFYFDERSAHANNLSIVLVGPSTTDLNLSNVLGSVSIPTDSVSNGGDIDGLIIDGSTATNAAYVIGASTTITSLSIKDSTSAFGIDLSAKSGTLDLTGLTLSGNTFGTNIIRYNSASNLTVTVAADSGIDTGSGSSNFGDATVSGGGTLTIQVPVATTTFTGFPTANNSNGVAPAPVIGFYSSASAAGFIAGLDTSDPEYSAGSFTVLLSDYPGVTHVVGDAVGWVRTDYIPVDAGDPPSAVSLAAAFREILSETGVALVGNGTPELIDKLNYVQVQTLFEVDAGPIDFESALDKKEALTSPVTGLATFETTVVRGIEFIQNKYGKEIQLPSPLMIAAAPDALTSPIFTNFLVVRAGDPTEDPFEHGLASTASGLTDRPEIRMISTLFIGATDGGGASPADIADAVRTNLANELGRIDAAITSRARPVDVQVTVEGGGGLGPEDIARLERIENQLTADTSKGATRYKRFLSGTATVILDKDVTFDPEVGFTLTEHQEPPP